MSMTSFKDLGEGVFCSKCGTVYTERIKVNHKEMFPKECPKDHTKLQYLETKCNGCGLVFNIWRYRFCPFCQSKAREILEFEKDRRERPSVY